MFMCMMGLRINFVLIYLVVVDVVLVVFLLLPPSHPQNTHLPPSPLTLHTVSRWFVSFSVIFRDIYGEK